MGGHPSGYDLVYLFLSTLYTLGGGADPHFDGSQLVW